MKLVKLLYLSILIALPLGQFARVPLGLGFSGGVYIYDLLLPLMLGLWLVWKLGEEKEFRLPPLSGRIVLFTALAAISLLSSLRYLSNLTEFLVAALYLWRWLMYAGLYFVGVDLLRRFPGLRRKNYQVLNIGTVLFAVAGLLQFIFFSDFSQYVSHGWDPHYYRVLSTFFDPNFAGLYLTLGFVLLSSRFLHKSYEANRSYFAGILGLGILLMAIVLTFSRSTYLAFAAAVGFLGLLKSRKLLFAMMLAGVLAFVFIPRVQTRVIGAIQLDETTRLRLQDYSKTWKIVKDNPVLGVGFNTFRYIQEDYGYFRDDRGVNQPGGHAGAGADNSFLFLWATTGIGGLLAYLWLLWGQFRLGWERRQNWAGLALAASVVTVVAHTQFVNALFYPWIMAWIWVLTALVASNN